MSAIDVHVKIGEAKTGAPGERLRAVLGSCVGIAFIWREKNLFGLAHCLLPDCDKPYTTPNAKFVNHAVPTLMALMKIRSENIDEIEVHIAGGGNMMPQHYQNFKDDVGSLNIQAARKTLKQYGFRIKTEEVGGFNGRQIFLDCSHASVDVKTIEKVSA